MGMFNVVGIDLGTTNTCVAVINGGEAKVIQTREGMTTIPSIVAFTESGERLVGLAAKRQATLNPGNTFFGIKRLVGRRFDDPEVQLDRKLLPFKIIRAQNGDAWAEARGKGYPPPQISAEVLREAKETAEAHLGQTVTEAVITVPAYFSDAQRQATTAAGRIAGLTVLRIINEPTAAALAFGLQIARQQIKQRPPAQPTSQGPTPSPESTKRSWWSSLWSKPPQAKVSAPGPRDRNSGSTIAVFDLGGGTFDISILEIGDGVFEVKCTSGDTHLGGEDFDLRILNHLCESFKKETGEDLRQNAQALQRLKEAAEAAKVELSSRDQTNINIQNICIRQGTPLHFIRTVTRKEVESLVGDLVSRLRQSCEKAIKDADLKKSDINDILLVGGMTRMPLIQRLVEDVFQRKPRRDVNPDEAVAVGAAIQAGVLTGAIKDVLLLDVTPLSLGIETEGGIFTRLLERNTTIPTKKSQVFSTVRDGQQIVGIRIYQGDREMSVDNNLLGEFNLVGLPIAPRGVPKIEVTFDVNNDGILYVSAKDKATAKEQSMRVQGACGLSELEIQRIIKEAEAHKTEDRKRRVRAEAANEGDALMYQLQKSLRDDQGAFPPAERNRIEQLISEGAGVLQKGDVNSIKAKNIEFAQALLKAGDIVYRAKAASAERHQLFVSYAREDAGWVERIKKSLAIVTRTGNLTLWIDRMIETGSEWEDRVLRAVDQSAGAILVVSGNFLSSDFIMGRELPKLFAARERRGLYLVPVVVTYCPFHLLKDLGQFQTFNDPQKPLSSLADWEVDKELTRLAEEIAARALITN